MLGCSITLLPLSAVFLFVFIIPVLPTASPIPHSFTSMCCSTPGCSQWDRFLCSGLDPGTQGRGHRPMLSAGTLSQLCRLDKYCCPSPAVAERVLRLHWIGSLGWENPLRPLSPSIPPALPSPPLNCVPRFPSTYLLNPSRDGNSTTAQGSLCQGWTTLLGNKFFQYLT